MDTTVGISDSLPMFRGGLRAVLARASFVVDEPVDIVAWAVGGRSGRGDTGHDGRAGPGLRAVLLTLEIHRDWSVLDELHDRRPDMAVVTLLSQPDYDAYRDALARGALSAAPRSASGSHIVAVVKAAADGRSLLPATVLTALASSARNGRGPGALGDEERRWLLTLADGTSVEDLAWRSGYSRRTMYRRLRQLYRHLGADRREGALVAAARAGII
jgi:DNA-binding NarL/FixJ family response regulator